MERKRDRAPQKARPGLSKKVNINVQSGHCAMCYLHKILKWSLNVYSVFYMCGCVLSKAHV